MKPYEEMPLDMAQRCLVCREMHTRGHGFECTVSPAACRLAPVRRWRRQHELAKRKKVDNPLGTVETHLIKAMSVTKRLLEFNPNSEPLLELQEHQRAAFRALKSIGKSEGGTT